MLLPCIALMIFSQKCYGENFFMSTRLCRASHLKKRSAGLFLNHPFQRRLTDWREAPVSDANAFRTPSEILLSKNAYCHSTREVLPSAGGDQRDFVPLETLLPFCITKRKRKKLIVFYSPYKTSYGRLIIRLKSVCRFLYGN